MGPNLKKIIPKQDGMELSESGHRAGSSRATERFGSVYGHQASAPGLKVTAKSETPVLSPCQFFQVINVTVSYMPSSACHRQVFRWFSPLVLSKGPRIAEPKVREVQKLKTKDI